MGEEMTDEEVMVPDPIPSLDTTLEDGSIACKYEFVS